MKIIQSTIEQLAWYVVFIVIVGSIIIGTLAFLGYRQSLATSRKIDKRTTEIQDQVQCIGEYFNQTDRGHLLIPNLSKCNIIRVQ